MRRDARPSRPALGCRESADQHKLTPLPAAGKASLSAAIFFGMLVGGLTFGLASDRLGRRSVLTFSLAINALFGFLTGAVGSNYTALMFCRVAGGFGVGGSIPGVFSFAAELLPAKDRGFWLSTVAWWWMIGSLWAAGLAWLIIGTLNTSWQVYAASCAVPAALAAVLVHFLLPESPRYLLAKGDAAGAASSIVRIATANGVETRLSPSHKPQYTLRPVEGPLFEVASDDRSGLLAVSPTAVAADGSASSEGGPEGVRSWDGASRRGGVLEAVVSVFRPVRDFFSPPHARTSWLLMIVWFCLSFGWYGLILWIPTLFVDADFELNVYQDSFLVAASNLPGNLISAVLMDRIGRKGVLAGSLFAACACAAGMPFARSEVAAVVTACTLNAVSTASWNALDCLSTESFPTSMRTSAMGLLSASGRIGSIAAQFVFAQLIKVSLGALLGSASAVLFAGAAAALLLRVDPMGKRLDD